MSYSLLTFLPWLLISFVLAALHITSAVILLRERHSGPWLMLAGSATALLGQIASMVVQAFLMQSRSGPPPVAWLSATSSLSSLGSLLFAIGLLLHALRQRGKANRIAELEAILNSRSNP